MKLSRYLGGTAVAVLAAGCLLQSSAFANGKEEIAFAAPPGVTIEGPRFADGAGMTLYTSDKDVDGKSNCDAECAKMWKAVAVPAKIKGGGNWTVAKGFNGEAQWAFRGKPVYTFANDKSVGEAKGGGSGWTILTIATADEMMLPVGLGIREVNDAAGRSLVNHRNMTLYTFEGNAKKPVAAEWTPVYAAQIANPVGDFTLFKREDGTEQWAFKGKPLYTFENDVAMGEAKGMGADPRFQVALVSRYFMPPNTIVRNNLGFGTVMATAEGKSLYMRDGYRYQIGSHYTRPAARGVPAQGRNIGTRGCDAKCLETWHPYTAAADAVPAGHWTIVTRTDGTRQWAYQGYALYTYTGDKKPGDMIGNDQYTYLVSEDTAKASDPTLPVSLNWHIVFP